MPPLFALTLPAWGWVVLVIAVLVVIGRIKERRVRVFHKSKGSLGFASVAGAKEAQEDLRELVDFLADPEKYQRLGATVPKGALLVGPPGTGKTLLARSVAEEAGVPFIAASGSDFVEMFVGVGAKRIRELYAEARSHGRAIVFIDEIDALARRRATEPGLNPGSTAEHENTLIALLTELDGFERSEVVTIGATNRPDVLDPAVTRPGRLDRRIEVPLPDRRDREEILAVHVRNKPVAADLDLAVLAARTPGMSGADLARVANEAALTAVRRGLDEVTASCFDEAVELVALGRPRFGALVTERDRRITAWHEAGHTVAALLLADAEDPVAVSITPRGPAGGVTWMGASDDCYLSLDQAEARLVVMLAGRAAEEVLLGGSFTQGATSDLASATDLAASMVDRFGFSERGLAVRLSGSQLSDRAVARILDTAHQRARALLAESSSLLEEVARLLLERERLDAVELHALKNSVLPVTASDRNPSSAAFQARETAQNSHRGVRKSSSTSSVYAPRISSLPRMLRFRNVLTRSKVGRLVFKDRRRPV